MAAPTSHELQRSLTAGSAELNRDLAVGSWISASRWARWSRTACFGTGRSASTSMCRALRPRAARGARCDRYSPAPRFRRRTARNDAARRLVLRAHSRGCSPWPRACARGQDITPLPRTGPRRAPDFEFPIHLLDVISVAAELRPQLDSGFRLD